jgi:rubrerythrin
MTDTRVVWVTEVHNFGGFFGGDTVTLSATPWPEGEEETLTIDEKALDNIPNRHTVAPEMLFQLVFSGERIDNARLLAARELETLNQALGDAPSASRLDGPQIRAYHCRVCNLWVTGQPRSDPAPMCIVCGQALD